VSEPRSAGGRWRPFVVAGAVALVVVVAFIAFLAARTPVTATSQVLAGVVVSCDAGIGLESEACRDTVDAIISAGPPTRTFELEDVARVDLRRSMFGFGPECEAAWFLERYPDDPVATEAVACPAP